MSVDLTVFQPNDERGLHVYKLDAPGRIQADDQQPSRRSASLDLSLL